jgi:hypothetical protein
MPKNKSAWPILLLVLFLGLVLGSILGELGARLTPPGSLHEFFAAHLEVGAPGEVGMASPIEVDLRAFRFILGFTLRLNILGILGLVGAGLAYYRLSH